MVTYEHISIEKAYDLAETLREVQREDTQANTLFNGFHPETGRLIFIIVPMLGDATIVHLPS